MGGFLMGTAAGKVQPLQNLVLDFDAGNNNSVLTSVDVLVVGGGGGGGVCYGGGGGGGGVVYSTNFVVTPGTAITVTVGAGGTNQVNTSGNGGPGGNSVFGTLTAIGGGFGGGNCGNTGGAGGSGGGGSGTGAASIAGGAGTTGQGFSGNSSITAGGGGGGGAGGGGLSQNRQGNNGILNSITGVAAYYGGGGSGGGSPTLSGGLGGGGSGGTALAAGVADATANTGGGGGGSIISGGTGVSGLGGSGIVIVRYSGKPKATGGTISYNGSFTIHRFTSTGSTTFTPDSTTYDLSTSLSNGTLTNGATGYLGNNGTVFFDGTNDLITYSPSVLDNITEGTISAWVYLNSITAAAITARQRDGVNTYAVFSIGSYSTSGGSGATGTAGKLYWHGKNGVVQAASTNNITANRWHHVVVTFSASQASFYINGVFDSTTAGDYVAGNSSGVLSPNYTQIGCWNNNGGTSFPLNGYIANLSVYNRVLGSSEISQLFDSQKGTFIAAPFTRKDLFWYVDAGNPSSYPGTGTSWYDLSGNGYVGTLTNGPTYSSANNGYIQFDGSNDYSSMGLSNATYTQLTFCGWFYMTSYSSYSPMIQNRSSGGSTTGMSVSPSATQLGYHWNDDGGTWGYNSGLSILQNTWAFYAVSVSPTTAIFFVNGSFVTRSYSHSSTTFGAGCFISADVNGGRYTASRVGKAWVYSRALDYSEILQNYNAYRGLYGL